MKEPDTATTYGGTRRMVALLFTLLIASALLPAAPAHAGATGKNCEVWYAQGNPASGWGFQLCVKLEHSPEIHSWRANASIHSSTPGMQALQIRTDLVMNGGLVGVEASNGGVSSYHTAQTIWVHCAGEHEFAAVVVGKVRWPNGVWSDGVRTETKNYPHTVEAGC